MIDKNELKEIKTSIYWIGNSIQKYHMQVNSYLLVDEEAVLFDTSSREDSTTVIKNILDIINPEKLKYIVITSIEPEICSGLYFFLNTFKNAKIITSENFAHSLKTYLNNFDCIYLENLKYKLKLSSGRLLNFIPAPYVDKIDSFFCYDEQEKILFSSNLFSSYNEEFLLYADETHIDGFIDFHENFFSDSEVIKSVIYNLKKYSIDMIAPLRGSIIDKNLTGYMDILKNIKTGKKYEELYKKKITFEHYDFFLKKVKRFFDKESIFLEDLTEKIKNFDYYDESVLNLILEEIYMEYGEDALDKLVPLVNNFIKENSFDNSRIFYIYNQKNDSLEVNKLKKEINVLKEKNNILEKSLEETKRGLIINELTNLFNGRYFMNKLRIDLKEIMEKRKNYSIIFIDIDNLAIINMEYGNDVGDETIKNVSYILREIKGKKHNIYKMKGAMFVYYIENEDDDALEIAEKIRNMISGSKVFIEKITVSIAIFRFIELFVYEQVNFEELLDEIMNRANMRLKIVKSLGSNVVFEDAMLRKLIKSRGKILICDFDSYSSKIIRKELEKLNFEVVVTDDGEEAYKIIKSEKIVLVISSIMINKIDAFELKKMMNEFSAFKSIGFILIDFSKSPDTIKRAYSLDIDYYLKKPFLIEELMEIVKKMLKNY